MLKKLPAVLALAILLPGCDLLFPVYDYEIRYEVTGTAEMVRLLYVIDGDNPLEHTTSPPWSVLFTAGEHQAISIAAENRGTAGAVMVKVFVDDELRGSSTSATVASVSFVTGP